MKKAVITGATGAIGRALIETLTAHGVAVLALCRKGERAARLPHHPLLTVEYCDLAALACYTPASTDAYETFYHLAWAGTNGTARADPYLQCANIRYALDAVNTAKRLGCHTFIGAGSQAEYGRTLSPLTPLTPALPENGYGMAKLAAGNLTRLAANAAGMRHIWVRILSVYGPNDNKNSLISSAILGFLKGTPPPFTKGEQLWDFLYSRDAARALFLLGERGKNGAVYPLGSGVVRPLKEYLSLLRDVVAPNAPLHLGGMPYAKDQVMHLCADISTLTADTGWYPTTDFASGIRQTAEWWQAQKNF